MVDVSNIFEAQQMDSTPIKQLQTKLVTDSNASYFKQLSAASEHCIDEETEHGN